MYGMVNQAVRDLILQQHGEETWSTIRALAGIEEDEFVHLSAYDDATTYALVGAISSHFGQSPEDVLRGFGRWWLKWTSESGYSAMLDMYGRDLRTFLSNLDNLHSHSQALMPALQPPSFSVSEQEGDRFSLTYRSNRVGLTPMVQGLLEGLGDRFGTPVRATCTSLDESENRTVARFDVQFALVT